MMEEPGGKSLHIPRCKCFFFSDLMKFSNEINIFFSDWGLYQKFSPSDLHRIFVVFLTM